MAADSPALAPALARGAGRRSRSPRRSPRSGPRSARTRGAVFGLVDRRARRRRWRSSPTSSRRIRRSSSSATRCGAAGLGGRRVWRFVLGTDGDGRDMLSRLIYGARVSLFIGLSVMSVSFVRRRRCSASSARWRGRSPMSSITRVMDLIMAVPSLVLAILVVAILGPSLANTIVAVTIVYLPRYVRLVRASALGELDKDYVTAARVAGVGPLRLMFVDHPAQLPRAAHRAGRARRLRRHPRGGGARLPRPRRAAADAGMGLDARRFARIHPLRPWIVTLPGPRHPRSPSSRSI